MAAATGSSAVRPRTSYAKSGDVNVAYQVFGEGDTDLVVVQGLVSHIDLYWDWPPYARFMERLASFCRVITFDKRGVGLSDRLPVDHLPALEERMDDVRAVMDAAGSERAALFGISEGGPMALLFAATYPDRVSALVLHGAMPRTISDDDYPFGPPRDAAQRSMAELIDPYWGDGVLLEVFAPSLADDPAEAEGWTRRTLAAASPAAIETLWAMAVDVDVRAALPAIQAPTLVLHRRGDRVSSRHGARWMTERIPDAEYVELDGADHFPWTGDQDPVVAQIERFLTGVSGPMVPERVLATVMFTDIVGSTDKASELGDDGWTRLLDQHDELARRYVERFRGREVNHTGDGIVAVFDGPARAVRCAQSLVAEMPTIGIEVRVGVHTGEIELRGDEVAGVAVHIGARTEALAGPGEVLTTRTVKDLVVGSDITFEERGTHELRGVPGTWELYAAVE
jgi:pimeloyl-ACP methyl ester carboxylesterase